MTMVMKIYVIKKINTADLTAKPQLNVLLISLLINIIIHQPHHEHPYDEPYDGPGQVGE